MIRYFANGSECEQRVFKVFIALVFALFLEFALIL